LKFAEKFLSKHICISVKSSFQVGSPPSKNEKNKKKQQTNIFSKNVLLTFHKDMKTLFINVLGMFKMLNVLKIFFFSWLHKL